MVCPLLLEPQPPENGTEIELPPQPPEEEGEEPQPPEEEEREEEPQQLSVAGGPQPLAAPLHPELSPGRHPEPAPTSQQPASKEPLSQQDEDAVPQPPTELPQPEDEPEPQPPPPPEPQPLPEPHEETPTPLLLPHPPDPPDPQPPPEPSQPPPDPQAEPADPVAVAPKTVKGVEVISRRTKSITTVLASELLKIGPLDSPFSPDN